MTVFEFFSLFAIMALLAAVPSSSVALVAVRAISRGTADGIAVSAGIVTGDILFVLLALFGLSALASSMGALFVVIKYVAACYLFWLGISLLRKGVQTAAERGACPAADAPAGYSAESPKSPGRVGLIASYSAGLMLTLGDIKAIFFYLGLLPAFVDLAALTVPDVLAIIGITLLSVGGVKIAYAVYSARLAVSMREKLGTRVTRPAALAGGCAMIGAGCYLLVRD